MLNWALIFGTYLVGEGVEFRAVNSCLSLVTVPSLILLIIGSVCWDPCGSEFIRWGVLLSESLDASGKAFILLIKDRRWTGCQVIWVIYWAINNPTCDFSLQCFIHDNNERSKKKSKVYLWWNVSALHPNSLINRVAENLLYSFSPGSVSCSVLLSQFSVDFIVNSIYQ